MHSNHNSLSHTSQIPKSMEPTLLQSLSLLLLFSLLATTSAVPAKSIVGSVKSLSNSGFNAVALTLQFANTTLLPPNTHTIFAPPDAAFERSGQPSLSLLHFHFSPLSVSLRSLTVGYKIPTFFPNHSLTVTSSPDHGVFALNGVKINASALYNDGSLVVYRTQWFLNPDFANVVNRSKDNCFSCCGGQKVKHTVAEASGFLKISGFSIMAAFLDLQIGEFSNNTAMTVFAPPDAALKGFFRNFTRSPSIFLRHIVPFRISGSDLRRVNGGMVFPTFLEGFRLELNKSGNTVLRIKGADITDVDMYSNEWMVVHGIQKSLMEEEDLAKDRRDVAKSSSEMTKAVFYGVTVFVLVFCWLIL